MESTRKARTGFVSVAVRDYSAPKAAPLVLHLYCSGESARGEGPLAALWPGFGTACPGTPQQRRGREKVLALSIFSFSNHFIILPVYPCFLSLPLLPYFRAHITFVSIFCPTAAHRVSLSRISNSVWCVVFCSCRIAKRFLCFARREDAAYYNPS